MHDVRHERPVRVPDQPELVPVLGFELELLQDCLELDEPVKSLKNSKITFLLPNLKKIYCIWVKCNFVYCFE